MTFCQSQINAAVRTCTTALCHLESPMPKPLADQPFEVLPAQRLHIELRIGLVGVEDLYRTGATSERRHRRNQEYQREDVLKDGRKRVDALLDDHGTQSCGSDWRRNMIKCRCQ